MMGYQEGIDPVDPHLLPIEKPRLSRQCSEILERLRVGPATNIELQRYAQRFGARIHDLRHHGFQIELTHRDHERGITLYELKESA